MPVANSRLIIAVLAASILSSLITAVVLRPSTTNAPPSNAEQGPDWSELNSKLKDLILALQPLSAPVARPVDQSDTVTRTPLEEPLALQEIAKHLEDLKGLVASQSWQGGSQAVELAEAGIRYPDAQWPALGELSQRLKVNRKNASRQLFFLTPAMALERYGRPTMITTRNDGSVQWSYDNMQEGDARMQVYLRFMDGYVISVF